MKRIEKISEALRELNGPVSASELAERLGLSRANVSSDLNQLCQEGIASKSGTKPVFYSAVQASSLSARMPRTGEEKSEGPRLAVKSDLDRFLEENHSLFHGGELAKAAVLYPPHGMHILLLGETGVGKSMFARMIFDYAVYRGRIRDPHSFVPFNCADYANNPELLVGQLFGVLKGAYTGADHERAGLLDQADGGILFLDEIHRLPPEGQEMLFTYMDRGVYRRLGETENTRSVRTMLICATTENPESSLLKSFVRRIPLRITIPNLEERSLEERLNLIKHFFILESQRLSNPIHVSINSIRALLGYDCPNNIGGLKADIQLLCARAYSDYLAQKKDTIVITSFALPPNIRQGVFAEKNRRKLWNILNSINSRFIVFDETASSATFGNQWPSSSIYELIDSRTREMNRIGASQDQVDEVIGSLIAEYYNQYSKNVPSAGGMGLETIVDAEIIATVDKVLEKVSALLGRSLGHNIRQGLSLHLSSMIRRMEQGLPIVNPRLRYIQEQWPEVFKAACAGAALVEDDFNIRLPPDEIGFMSMFFIPDDLLMVSRSMVQVIVIAHGRGIASGMAETANAFLGFDIIKGFDVPLDERKSESYLRIKEYLKSRADLRDLFLLIDMGSLESYGLELERELGIRTKTLPLASTFHVLEAGRKASLGYSLEDIYEEVRAVAGRMLNRRRSFKAAKENGRETVYLLTVCTTGEGSARVLGDFLAGKLDLKQGFCQIVPLQLVQGEGLSGHVELLKEQGRIIAVVSAFDTGVRASHFQLSFCMTDRGIKEIQACIDGEELFAQVSRNLQETLDSLKDPSIYQEIRRTLERTGRILKAEMDLDMTIGMFCHISCMIDRLLRGGQTEAFPGREEWMRKYPQEIELVRQECESLAAVCDVQIPLDEVCYLLMFYKREGAPNLA
ncbi:MAG: sigma 54-interacting transcriptional regulator [Treponema sp.]|jgi:transcriptional regulator with AAA-type ATPase domain/transcriptional regulatory protein LevR|nr:sigma 54-interacting transcriptional regulator [Treponema sp.]